MLCDVFVRNQAAGNRMRTKTNFGRFFQFAKSSFEEDEAEVIEKPGFSVAEEDQDYPK
jgi:hypothetical protein